MQPGNYADLVHVDYYVHFDDRVHAVCLNVYGHVCVHVYDHDVRDVRFLDVFSVLRHAGLPWVQFVSTLG